MKKFGKVFSVLSIVVIALALAQTGCNKPTEELERAKDAIEDAKRTNAECARMEIASAERALADGKDAMESWKFKKARSKFEQAYSKAISAKNKVCKAEEPVPVRPATAPKPKPKKMDEYTVVKGDCLWWIAEDNDMYSDPFQWPIIYDANRDEIDSTAHRYGHYRNEEDWIYPDQKFDIPRDASTNEIKNARRRAGAPKPYDIPGR